MVIEELKKKDGLIRFKGIRYPYKLSNFTYIKIVHKYKTKIVKQIIDMRDLQTIKHLINV